MDFIAPSLSGSYEVVIDGEKRQKLFSFRPDIVGEFDLDRGKHSYWAQLTIVRRTSGRGNKSINLECSGNFWVDGPICLIISSEMGPGPHECELAGLSQLQCVPNRQAN